MLFVVCGLLLLVKVHCLLPFVGVGCLLFDGRLLLFVCCFALIRCRSLFFVRCGLLFVVCCVCCL